MFYTVINIIPKILILTCFALRRSISQFPDDSCIIMLKPFSICYFTLEFTHLSYTGFCGGLTLYCKKKKYYLHVQYIVYVYSFKLFCILLSVYILKVLFYTTAVLYRWVKNLFCIIYPCVSLRNIFGYAQIISLCVTWLKPVVNWRCPRNTKGDNPWVSNDTLTWRSL